MNPASKVELNTGSEMPVIGLGTWQMGSDVAEIVAEALSLGYRMLDTSGDYGTQPGVGEGLRKSNVSRQEVFIVTKVEEDDDGYEAARKNVSEMGLTQADLILIHRPPNSSAGQKIWKGLIRAHDEGITRDIGVSNYSTGQINELISDSGVVPAVNQIEWSPFGHDMDMLDFCRENDIVIQAYSPLTREKMTKNDKLRDVAARYDKTPEQILLRWNIQLGCVPLPKASSREHLQENLDVFDFIISENDMATLSSLNEHYSSLSTLQYL